MKTLRTLNLLLGISFLVQLICTISMILELPWYTFFQIHKINGIALFLLIFIHLFLNRKWIKNTLKK